MVRETFCKNKNKRGKSKKKRTKKALIQWEKRGSNDKSKHLVWDAS